MDMTFQNIILALFIAIYIVQVADFFIDYVLYIAQGTIYLPDTFVYMYRCMCPGIFFIGPTFGTNISPKMVVVMKRMPPPISPAYRLMKSFTVRDKTMMAVRKRLVM